MAWPQSIFASRCGVFLLVPTLALSSVVDKAVAGDSVQFKPYGVVAERCALTAKSGGITRTVDLRSSGSDAVDFNIDCNLPIDVTIAAENGAFQLDVGSAPEHSADYTGSVGYTAGFTLPLGSGSWAVADLAGASLKGAGRNFTPTGANAATPPFAATLSFRLNWNAPSADLLAGAYRETIVITVTGRDVPLAAGS